MPKVLGKKQRIVIAIPSGITEVERRAVKESAERAGARDVFLSTTYGQFVIFGIFPY